MREISPPRSRQSWFYLRQALLERARTARGQIPPCLTEYPSGSCDRGRDRSDGGHRRRRDRSLRLDDLERDDSEHNRKTRQPAVAPAAAATARAEAPFTSDPTGRSRIPTRVAPSTPTAVPAASATAAPRLLQHAWLRRLAESGSPAGNPGVSSSITGKVDPGLVDINTVLVDNEGNAAGTGMVVSSSARSSRTTT